MYLAKRARAKKKIGMGASTTEWGLGPVVLPIPPPPPPAKREVGVRVPKPWLGTRGFRGYGDIVEYPIGTATSLPPVSKPVSKRTSYVISRGPRTYPTRALGAITRRHDHAIGGARPMSGLSSRPFGPNVSYHALGAISPPAWYQAMYGCSLGDDQSASDAGPQSLTDGQAQWQKAMLDTTKQIADAQWAFAEKDRWIRYVQVAATLSIPLAAAIWKAVFRTGSGV